MEEKRNVPKLRFPGFTDPWEQRKLGEVVDVRGGKDYKHLKPGPIPVYGTGGLMTYVDDALSKNEDAVGIGRKGTIDQPYKLHAPFWTVDTLFYAVPKTGNDIEFVLCCFQRINWKAKDESTGLPSLSKSAINDTRLLTPRLGEQSRIGALFAKLDSLIALHQRKLDHVKELKKGLLQKMFPKEGANVPELRFPGFTDPWEQRRLGEIGSARSGVGFPNVEQGGSEGTPFYKVSDMNLEGNEFQLRRANNYVTDEQIERKRWKPINEVPAMFFAKVGAAVLLNRKRLVDEPFLLDNNTMAYSFDCRFWDVAFGRILFDGLDLTSLVQVGALPSYNASDIESMEVAIPSKIAEQVKIGALFAKLDSLIALHQRELDHVKELKKGLLQQMFV